MKFVVHVDNGESYSDYTDYCVCVCDTEDEAKRAAHKFDEWKQHMLDEFADEDGYIGYCLGDEHQKAALAKFPWPYGDGKTLPIYLSYLSRYSSWYVPVPAWAE